MPKLKWAGIIRGEAGALQQGVPLPGDAVKMAMPASMGEMMKKAAVFLPLPLTVLLGAMFVKTYLSGQVVVQPVFTVLGFCASVPALLLHELLHALPYPKTAVVHIGLVPQAMAAVVLVSHPLGRGRFIFMSLLPTILGIVPIALFLCFPPDWTAWNGFFFGFAAMGLVSPYPDLYNVFQVLRQTPRRCQIQFWGDDTYYFMGESL
ncbi:DUF3267 domain-containing protein [Acutalibacter sp. 1XD8-33]|uniref:DUF3267 domain-containing protein n=1 Tax=Acutalibacter sp. 1XD8-33 TaxID=2320081 RepID=UPI0013143966|nr:DUF3267 domain-containing protein [Acutalibacter sp. 1XD8-33]